MSSTVARKTASATLVMANFSKLTSDYYASLQISGLKNTYCGIHPKTVVHYAKNVSIFLMTNENTFKYKVNVSILNLQKDKLFTKEYFGEFQAFGDKNKFDEHFFSLMLRSELLSPQNGYLFNDKLTLHCELEVLEEGQKPKIVESYAKDLNNLSDNLQSLWIDGKFNDVTLMVVGGKEFRVHKNILAARSPVFAAMFEHDCKEKLQNKVTITDMDEDVCGEMLSYIYTGKVKDLDRFTMELLVAADKYQLPSLKSVCSKYMRFNLTVESVVNVLILADLHQATLLKSKCIEFICAKADQVQATDGWMVLDTKADLLKELFMYSTMNK